MKESLLNTILGITAILIAVVFKIPSWTDLGIGILATVVVKIGLIVWTEWSTIKLILQSRLIKPNQPIRISIAYLFRIKIDGKYFLIRNHRDQPGYQPVGGVYRYLERENSEFFDRIGLIPDHHMDVDKQSRNDLRKLLKQRKTLRQFLQWFDTKRNRETDPWREFYEELIEERIIPRTHFPYIQYTYCKNHMTAIQRSVKFPVDEFLYADIYELKWDSDLQKEEFEKLMARADGRYVFATPEEINKGFTKNGKMIISHTKKIL